MTYDSAVWKPFASGPENGPLSTTTWKLKADEKVQITVASREERLDEAAYTAQLGRNRLFLGEPPELVREDHESLAGRDWLVGEYRYPDSGKGIRYFLPTQDGHVRLFVTGRDAALSKHHEAVEAFLGKLQIK